MRNIAMAVRYDGTGYHGWQRQNNGMTIQQAIEEALTKLTGVPVQITGCSRTDAGVHALFYVFNFYSDTDIPTEKLPYALNYHLARFCNKGKRYIYRIWNSGKRNPFLMRYSWQVPYKLDIEKMKASAPTFEGTHDFCAFMAAGGDQKTTVRTIRNCSVEQDADMPELITVSVEADAFLYNMVRIITGTLIEIGMGKIEPEELMDIINSGDRKRCGLTAPPQGLFLKNVYYDFQEV